MVRLILYNIMYLEGHPKKGHANPERFWRKFFPPKDIDKKIAKVLKKYNPDIVSLVEFGGDYVTSEGAHISHFEKELGLKHYVMRRKYLFKGLFNLLRFFPLTLKQYNAILSKKKISSRTNYFKEGIKRTIIRVEMKVPQKIVLLLVHLSLMKRTRKKQIDELINIINKIKEPVILMGDFNTFTGEAEIKDLLDKTKLNDKFHSKKGSGRYTYPSFHPKKRVDYVLTSDNIKVKKYKILKTELSDHLPILVDFEVKKR